MPSGVDISVADFGVNAGPSRAAKRLQRVVMAAQDGKIGPKTLSMVFNMGPATLLDKYAEARESYYRSLKTFEIYGRGWLRRNDEVLEQAKSMVSYSCWNHRRITGTMSLRSQQRRGKLGVTVV